MWTFHPVAYASVWITVTDRVMPSLETGDSLAPSPSPPTWIRHWPSSHFRDTVAMVQWQIAPSHENSFRFSYDMKNPFSQAAYQPFFTSPPYPSPSFPRHPSKMAIHGYQLIPLRLSPWTNLPTCPPFLFFYFHSHGTFPLYFIFHHPTFSSIVIYILFPLPARPGWMSVVCRNGAVNRAYTVEPR